MSWNPIDMVGNFWDGVGDSVNGLFSGFTNAIGVTDTKAGRRGLNALKNRADKAQKTLNERMAPINEMYQNAMQDRDMASVLTDYQNQMMDTENAASSGNVQNFMNPMYQRAMDSAANQALAGAGSSLQSSAANNAVANSVANASTNMWQQAFQNAMADARNRQGIYDNVMQSNLMPSLNWAQLNSDLAGTEYTKNMDLAQAAGNVAGQNQSWLGNIF